MRRRSDALAPLTALGPAFVVVLLMPLASAYDCPYPLGDALLSGDVRIVNGSVNDPEQMLVDMVGVGNQFSAGQISYDRTVLPRLHFTYETEVEYVAKNRTTATEVHVLAYREYSDRTGWNSRPVFLASEDVTEALPIADAGQPAQVVVDGGVWVAFQVSGQLRDVPGRAPAPLRWPDTGAFIVFRGNTNGTWGPITPLTPLFPGTVSLRPRAIETSTGAFFTYQTNANETDASASRIMGRPFNGASLGALETISVQNDLWSDFTPSLGAKGDRVAVVWASESTTATTGGATRVWLRVREPSVGWTSPILVSGANETNISYPAVTWHEDSWYVAWGAEDPAASPAGDASILMRAVNGTTFAPGPLIVVTNSSFSGDESSPALLSYANRLHLVWTSDSAADGSGVISADSDTHRAVFEGGVLGPVELVDRPADEGYADTWPGLVNIGGSLFVTYGLNMNDGQYVPHNFRQVIRLLERPPAWYDGLTASYSLRSLPGTESGVVVVRVRFDVGGQPPPPTRHLAIRLSDGSLIRLPNGFVEGDVRIPYANGRFYAPGAAYWCGLPVALNEGPFLPLPPTPPPPPWNLIAGAVLASLAVSAIYVWRRRRSLAAAKARRARRAARAAHRGRSERAADNEKGGP